MAFKKPYPTGWENLPTETTPVTANVKDNEDLINVLSSSFLTPTNSGADYTLDLSNYFELETHDRLHINFITAGVTLNNARLSIDGGITFVNIFIDGEQALGEDVQLKQMSLYYDGTNWEQISNKPIPDTFGQIVASGLAFSGSANDVIVDVGTYGIGNYKFIPYNFTQSTTLSVKLGGANQRRQLIPNATPVLSTNVSLPLESTNANQTGTNINNNVVDVNVYNDLIFAKQIIGRPDQTSSAFRVEMWSTDGNKDIRLFSNYLAVNGDAFDWILVRLHSEVV